MWNAHQQQQQPPARTNRNHVRRVRIKEMARDWMKDQSGKKKKCAQETNYFISLCSYIITSMFAGFIFFCSPILLSLLPLSALIGLLTTDFGQFCMPRRDNLLVIHLLLRFNIENNWNFHWNAKSSIIIIAPASPLRLPLSSSLWSFAD